MAAQCQKIDQYWAANSGDRTKPSAMPLARYRDRPTPGEPEMLRSVEKLEGLAIGATDGAIG